MNKFNHSVKQNKKTILVVAVVSIVAFILCLSLNIALSQKNAMADPSLQATLDQTSDAYYDALAAQEEAQARVNEAESTIAECERKIPVVQSKLNTRAKSMYMNRGFGEILELIIGATSIENLVNNIQYINIVNNKDAELVQSCRDLKAQVESEKAELDANLAAATEQANLAEEAFNTAQAALAAAQTDPQGGGGGGGGGYVPDAPCNPADIAATAIAIANAGCYWYEWGAAGPTTFDCSGLVSWCYGGGGSHIFTTTTFTSESSGFHRIDASQAVPGDVVSTSGHCGIYIGGGMMVHAPQTGEVVKISGVQGGMGYYTRR